jgi:hypothetical protein
MCCRTKRAELKRAVAARQLSLSDAIRKGKEDPDLCRLKIIDLLSALVSRALAEEILSDNGISHARRIKGLGWKQLIRLTVISRNL